MNIEILKPLKDETNKTWNLSSDEKLLNVLKLFSNEITKSTQACTEYMHDLNYSLNETETSLRNTFNEFIMLGNSQFIENRVYDDDEEDEEEDQTAAVVMGMTTSSALASSSGTIQQNPMTNLKDAYQLGQKALKLFYYDSNFLPQEDKIEDIYNIRPLPYIIGTKSYLNSTDAGLGGINVYDDDHDDDDVRGVDDSKSAAAVVVESISSQHGATVLAIDATTPTPNSEIGSNDFKPPPANKPSFPPPPPAPRTVTSSLFQSVVNPNDHDHNDTDDKDDDDDVDGNFSSNTFPSSQSSAPSKVPPPPPPPQLILPPTTNQPSLSSSLVPPPPSSSQPSSTVPPSIPIKSSNMQDVLNQKFSEKNIQKPIEQVQNPVVSLNNTAVNKVIDDTKGTEEVMVRNNENKLGKVDDDEDEDEDLFASKDDPFKLFGNKAAPKMNIRNSLGDLFGDNDINGSGGLFGRGTGTGGGGGGSRTSRGSFSSIFGDSNDDILFDDVPKSRGSISINSSTNNSPNKAKTTNFDDLFGDSKSTSTLTNNKSDTTSNANNGNLSKEVSNVKLTDLFGSNNNDDIFNTIIGTNKTVNTKSPMKTRFSSLFGDDDDDDDSLFAQKDKRKDEASINSANNINSKSIRNSLFDDSPSANNTSSKKSVFDDDDDDFKVVVPTASTLATAYNNNDSGSSTANDSALALSSVAPAAVVRVRLPIPLIPNRNSGHYDDDDDDDDNNDDDDDSDNRAANSKDQSSQLNIAGIKSVPSLSLSSSLSSQVPASTSNKLKSLFNDNNDNDSHGNNDTDDIQNDGIKTNHNTSPLQPVVGSISSMTIASIKQSIPIPLPPSNRNVQSFHDDDDNDDDNSDFVDNDDGKGRKNMKENSVILSSSSNNDLEDVVATSSSRKVVSSKMSALMSNIDPAKLQMMIPGQKNIPVLNNKNNSSSHDSSNSNDDNDYINDENSYGDKATINTIESSMYEQVETNEDELNKITLSRATNNTNKSKRAPSKKAFIVNDVDNDDNSKLLSTDDQSNIVKSSSTSNSLKLTMSSSLFGDDNAVSISKVAVKSSLFADVDNDVSSDSKKVIKSSLFGDDNYDDNNDNRLNTNSKISATSNSLLGNVSGKSKKAIKSNLFGVDTNNNDNNEIVLKKSVRSSLFDDDDDDITTTSSLFGDIDDVDKVIIKAKGALKSSLFLDDDNNVSSPSSKLKKSSLFDDEDNNDFLTVNKTLKQQKGGLFD